MPMPTPIKKQKSWYSMQAKGETATITIYDEIGFWGTDAEYFEAKLKELGEVKNIDLRLNCPGGNVFDGITIFNILKNHPAEITVYIDGLAASMGSYIAMVGDLIVMPENAIMMIHNPSTGAGGEEKDLQKAIESLKAAKKSMINVYMAKTAKTEQEISDIMDAETWLTGQEAVNLGFADVLEKPVEMAALHQFDLKAISSTMPKAIKKQLKKTKPSAVAGTNQGKKEIDMPKPTKEEQATPVKVDALNTDNAKNAENTRKAAIMAAFDAHKTTHSDILIDCLADDKVTIEQAQAKLLTALGAEHKPISNRITTVTDEKDNMRAGMAQAIAARAGLVAREPQNNFNGMTLLEMARKSLEVSGVSSQGDKLQIVGQAFTHSTSDFGGILSDVAEKAMLKGYDEAGETFQEFTSTGSLSDFKIVERADLGTYPSLPKVRPGAEYKQVTVGDRSVQMQLATYGSLFSITRQAIINDDLNAFTKLPNKMGRAAIRTIGDLVFNVLNANAAMSDGTALFHADHGNLGTGALTSANVDALRAKMAKQKENDAFLNIRPGFLLVPSELRGAAIQVMESIVEILAAKTATAPNQVANLAKVIDDARLAANAYYLLADPRMYDTIEVGYLDGNQAPYLEQQAGWSIDGTSFKVRIDAAVSGLDYRTMAKSTGV